MTKFANFIDNEEIFVLLYDNIIILNSSVHKFLKFFANT